ncbi:MAG: lysophospholipid acyltransferase family protein [Candidatus Omnitrophica bacterium]|nr:lysophospholipid acyltransferase family protein [Candidatus Omnitrophota bacterium]
MLYLLYKAGIFLALTLPIKASYKLADFIASMYYLLCHRDREVVKNNLKVVLNHDQGRVKTYHTSRMVFVNFARYLVEFFRASKIDTQFIHDNVEIEGRENLDRALKQGKGVILVSAHLGNWELGGMVLSMLGYKINGVAWTHKNKKINDFFLNQRRSKGLKIIPLGKTPRKVLTALRNNEIVGFIGDIDFLNPQKGITVKLFGRDTIMPKGPAIFSQKTGAPIVTVFLVRTGLNRFKLSLEPIAHRVSGNQKADLQNLTAKVSKRIESCILHYPEQWFMLTPRWQN